MAAITPGVKSNVFVDYICILILNLIQKCFTIIYN
jgi:hypothetical protein